MKMLVQCSASGVNASYCHKPAIIDLLMAPLHFFFHFR